MQRTGPLAGLKVLDLSRLLPGPYATLVLADLGAQVDKVEDPQGGDPVRQMPPDFEGGGATFEALNRNKRSIALDLKSPQGAGCVKRLAKTYDVLVESFRPGAMEKLGLGYAGLAEQNPRLVYCSISGFGQDGPDRLRAGHDLGYLARSGVLGYGGDRDGAPMMPGAQIADIGGGSLFALTGILAALYERERTGRGRWVDISMVDGAAAFSHMHLGAALLAGREVAPMTRGAEMLNGGLAGYNIYRTSDGRYLAVGALEPKFLTMVLDRLGRPDLLADAYDAKGDGSTRARRELQGIFEKKTLAQWLETFRDLDVCIEPVREGAEVLEDPQLRHRGLFDGKILKTPLARMSSNPPEPAPRLGADGRQILLDAGFSADEVTSAGVLGE